jgi:hypothetical protein
MASTAFSWVFGLVTLFGIGVLFIVFSQVFHAYLAPTIQDQVTNSPIIDNATKIEVNAGITKYLDFFDTMPFILFVVVVIFMFVAAIRKEGENV